MSGLQPNPHNYALGIALLLVVVVLWTLSNFVTQDLYEGGYSKPFLVTYVNTSAFALYLIPFILRGRRERSSAEYQPLAREGFEQGEETEESALNSDDEDPLKPLTTKETAKLAGVFSILWFFANWSVNASLEYTSVASATVLSSTSGFFTMGMGRIFHLEQLTRVKIISVITSFLGVSIVSFADSQQPRHPLAAPTESRPVLGDFLALGAAIFYGLYVTLLKKVVRVESRIDMQLFFGFVGLWSVLFFWPMGVVLHWSGMEEMELPTTSRQVTALLLNTGLAFTSDLLYAISLVKTTPLVVTIGLSLTIPLAVIGDFLLGRPCGFQVILGAVLVLGSFIAVGLDKSNVSDAIAR